ncbi:hypothetical protein [Mycoplasma sp. 125]|uniref:hypothetical protein n=1 Tax=Mycoplasma sp. 125 TaxID=3447505 RepID=UPI003F65B69A
MNEVKLRGILISKTNLNKTTAQKVNFLIFTLLVNGEFFELFAFEENADFINALDIKNKPNLLVIGKISKRNEKFEDDEKRITYHFDIIVSNVFLSANKKYTYDKNFVNNEKECLSEEATKLKYEEIETLDIKNELNTLNVPNYLKNELNETKNKIETVEDKTMFNDFLNETI